MFNNLKIKSLVEEYQLKNIGSTQQSIADGIGLSITTLRDTWEGKNDPKLSNLEKIAVYFNVDMNYFFDQHVSRPANYTFVSNDVSDKENPWKICFDLQKENIELKTELEKYRKEDTEEK